VLPEQYLSERIAAADVQELLPRVHVNPAPDLSRRFPRQHSARVRVRLRDGRVLEREQHDHEGFATRPMGWDATRRPLWGPEKDGRNPTVCICRRRFSTGR